MTEDCIERRLAANLVADVVGFSMLIEADEAGTVTRLKTLQTELIHPRVAKDGERIVKTKGDGGLGRSGCSLVSVSPPRKNPWLQGRSRLRVLVDRRSGLDAHTFF